MTNPANTPEKEVIPAGYQPMSAGIKRLEVPQREGYHRRWFRGDPARIARAQQAGYTFVDESDVKVNNFDLGGDAKSSGNTDLGTRVSVVSGDSLSKDGQPGRMYLMECPMHLYERSRSYIEERNDSIADAITGGMIGAGSQGETDRDRGNRYVKSQIPDLFKPKNRRT